MDDDTRATRREWAGPAVLALPTQMVWRRVLLAGAAAFGAASVLAAYSATPAMLIAASAVLGVAGATLSPSALGLISTMFRDARPACPASWPPRCSASPAPSLSLACTSRP